jgi:hypothetical protein
MYSQKEGQKGKREEACGTSAMNGQIAFSASYAVFRLGDFLCRCIRCAIVRSVSFASFAVGNSAAKHGSSGATVSNWIICAVPV